ncbi:NAD(P) transhydrogenase subunit alpha [Parazoarcus communis]|uniref:proton-translocating NAD(P)(+) transhydrogenase n=1 Tax=Parazoarcus communis SWub3 = DSM 12120 TaxID=1121029 RepID=A0A323UW09_9RHOO|nr:NAD(P) transhydrogenase subunit alpha [Parazoarcus communis]NMG69891.1 NAD(P)(+) transhydrogenase (Re/Si-specific) subunit alpha [Parazoarcus communis SWub3 = DSM 12120]PZA16664.1 NAD(P)(+) transhydrogenase (Re/Si-specific) subunit alpha [Azoarcus communis] [Parazoarcus communis SWub3 = DSM 12120]
MPLSIGVPAETIAGERRISVVPDVVKKYQGLGARVVMQTGAGVPAHYVDAGFAGVDFVEDAQVICADADLLLCVQPPSAQRIAAMKPGSVLLGMLQPWSDVERVKLLQARQITAFALELLPRISRSQSMDALSSQAAVAGYECALIAADHSPKFFPMLTYAAGTIRPAKVLVIGAGVAGLQAIATARRIGAMVEAYDVRPETREQIESLGAKFVDTGVAAAGSGGYARELTDEEKARQAERLAKAVGQCDALITTAAIPGKRAPRIITADMIARMKPGAVVVDMAAESGGNVEGTVAGEKVWINDVLVIGPTHITSRMPVHASEMYAKNLYNFISPFIKDGALALDWEDEVVAGCCLTHAGEVRHAGVAQVLGLQGA